MRENLDHSLPVSEEGLYPIRTVSETTGVNAITLRAWERRYGLFKPQRTPKGHRLYSQHDILKIQQVLRLLDQGVAIGRVANVLKQEGGLEDVTNTPVHSVGDSQQEAAKTEISEEQWETYKTKLVDYINSYDVNRLEQLHKELFSLYPLEITANSLIKPVLADLQSQAEQLTSLSGGYHFYWHFLQQRIGGQFQQTNHQQKHGIKIALMGTGGGKAEIDLLMLGLPLLNHGYQVIYLGSDMPLDAVPLSISRANVDALILNLSLQDEADTKAITTSIGTLAESITVPVFASSIAGELAKSLSSHSITILEDGSESQITTIKNKLGN